MKSKSLRKLTILLNGLFKPSRVGPLRGPLSEIKDPQTLLTREVRLTGHHAVYLTKQGLADMRELVRTIGAMGLFGTEANSGDIASACRQVYGELLNQRLMPDDGQEFVDLLTAKVRREIRLRRYLVPLNGVELIGIDSLSLGSFRVVRATPELLTEAGLDVTQDHLAEFLKDVKLTACLMGDATGTPKVAQRRFSDSANLTLSLLAIFTGANYVHAATRFRISMRMTAENSPGRGTHLEWSPETGEARTSYTFMKTARLKLDEEAGTRLRADGLFDRAFALIDRDDGSELERAILRAIYWYGDAHRDLNQVMQFVKYWSCIEAFFSLDGEVTQSVATGLAASLVFAGFQFVPPSEYVSLKAKIKKLYQLRSDAVHNGTYLHVSDQDVIDLSQWAALAILLMISLVDQGYSKLEEVREQAERLDRIGSKINEGGEPHG